MDVSQLISTLASLCGIAGFGILIVGFLRRNLRRLDDAARVSVDELTPGPVSELGDRPSLRDDVTSILEVLVAQGADLIEVQKNLAALSEELRDHVRSPHGCDARA